MLLLLLVSQKLHLVDSESVLFVSGPQPTDKDPELTVCVLVAQCKKEKRWVGWLVGKCTVVLCGNGPGTPSKVG